jgi:hypothetical protein
MKECQLITDMFHEVCDGLGDGEKEHCFHEHLTNCPCCREEFKWYGVTVQALKSLEPISPPGDFLAQLNTRLHATSPSSWFAEFFRNLFSVSPVVPLPVGVVALALVVVVGYVVYDQGHRESQVFMAGHQPSQTFTPDQGSKKTPGTPEIIASRPKSLPERGLPAAGAETRSPDVSGSPKYAMTRPDSANEKLRLMGPREGTPQFSASNLTVESVQIGEAVESVKRMLPDIQGQLIGEETRTGNNFVLLGLAIPPAAYKDLQRVLTNHGKVETGAGADIAPPRLIENDGGKVLLHVRFVPMQ